LVFSSATLAQPPVPAGYREGTIVKARIDERGGRTAGSAARPQPRREGSPSGQVRLPRYGRVALLTIDAGDDRYLARIPLRDAESEIDAWTAGTAVTFRVDGEKFFLKARAPGDRRDFEGTCARLRRPPAPLTS
jgi:hypothetical protein